MSFTMATSKTGNASKLGAQLVTCRRAFATSSNDSPSLKEQSFLSRLSASYRFKTAS